MEPITREQLELLIDLQTRETEAAHIRTELDRLPEKITAMEKGLSAFEEAIEAQKAIVKSMKKTYRSGEAELEMNQARVQKRQIQLQAVKTNKEYQAILKEIEEIRTSTSRIEDEMIQQLDSIDAAEKEIAVKEKNFAVEKQKIDGEAAILKEAADRQKVKYDELVCEGEAIAGSLDPRLKKKYDAIKSRSGGVAIVPVNDAVCRGCHLNIPPQMYNELHRGNELRFCPHCYRMIYVL